MATPGPQVSKIIDEPSETPPVERQQQTEKNETTEFEFVDPLPPDWTCSLCLDVLKTPTLTSCCGHHFCRQCIDLVIARDHVCPLCKDDGFQTFLDKGTSRKINALQLYCKLKSRGCQWVGEMGSLEAHLDVKKGDCEFVEVECDFSDFGCTTRMFRKDVPGHREENVHKHLVLMAVMAPRTGGGESERRVQEQRAELIHQQLQKKDEEVRQQLQEKDRQVKEAQDELAKLKEEMLQKDEQMESKVIQLKDETQEQLQQKDQEMKQSLAKFDEQLQKKDTQVKEAQDELVKLKEDLQQKLKYRVTEIQQEMQAQFQQSLSRLENELQARNKKIQEQLQDRDRQIKEVQEQLQQKDKDTKQRLAKLGKQMKEELQAKDKEIKELKGQQGTLEGKVQCVEVRTSYPPFQFMMTEFSKHKADNTEWHSPPFYSHPVGYKLCLAVFANGHRGFKVGYLNSFICTMQGEYDDTLTWPRRFDITIKVFTQSTGKWVVMRSIYSNSERNKPTSPREMYANDCMYFIDHNDLAPLLKNDCLQFRIASVKLQ